MMIQKHIQSDLQRRHAFKEFLNIMLSDSLFLPVKWEYQIYSLPSRSFICGFCANRVASSQGYPGYQGPNIMIPPPIIAAIYLCPNCNSPSSFSATGVQIPGTAHGSRVPNVPEVLDELYNEARMCTSYGAYTSTVLICRILLIHIAVEQGAPKNLNFVEYVEYLAKENIIPQNAKVWVDHIRKLGNQVNHKISISKEGEAKTLIDFIEMLLKIIYDYPARAAAQEL